MSLTAVVFFRSLTFEGPGKYLFAFEIGRCLRVIHRAEGDRILSIPAGRTQCYRNVTEFWGDELCLLPTSRRMIGVPNSLRIPRRKWPRVPRALQNPVQLMHRGGVVRFRDIPEPIPGWLC